MLPHRNKPSLFLILFSSKECKTQLNYIEKLKWSSCTSVYMRFSRPKHWWFKEEIRYNSYSNSNIMHDVYDEDNKFLDYINYIYNYI